MKWSERVSTDYAVVAILVAIALCARFLSFGYLSSLADIRPAAYPYPIIQGDSMRYAEWADNLITYHAYQDNAGLPLRSVPPAYPGLLAVSKALTGSFAPLVFMQILFAALAVALIYKMARTLLPVPYAVVPAIVYALDPMAVFTDSAALTDGLFSALLVCVVYLTFFQLFTRGRELVRWGLIGLLLGVLTMIRPIAQFLVVVFPAMYLVRTWMDGHQSDSSRLKMIAVCALAFALVVVPWMVRNKIVHDSFEISIIGTHNLLTNNVKGFLGWRAFAESGHPMPAILAMRHFGDPVFEAVEERIAGDLARATPPGKSYVSYEGGLAINYIFHDPIRYAYFHGVNTIPFFLSSSIASYGQIVRQLRDNEGFSESVTLSLLGTLGELRHPSNFHAWALALWSLAPKALEISWWLLVALLALIALVLRRRDSTILLCAVLVLYFAVLTGPMSNSRYRIPAEPYLVMLAAAGAHTLIERLKKRSS
ncbi:MAG TPA: glycosyltransferase family 39 protein [Candidatus Paceibacterota bacterium]